MKSMSLVLLSVLERSRSEVGQVFDLPSRAQRGGSETSPYAEPRCFFWGFSTVWLLLLAPVFLAAIASPGRAAEGEWISLFDGKSLAGWKAGENPGSFRVVDGAIMTDGPRAHLFYVGEGAEPASFENFEFSVEAMTKPGANSGVYFQTAWIAQGWPTGQGFEVQVNNSQPLQGNYVEYKRTGSLYGIHNVYPKLVRDDEWFTLSFVVRKPRVEVRINGVLVVDYTEPADPLPPGAPPFNRLGRGTFAFQAHDPRSHAFYRNVRVRSLPPLPAGSVVQKPLDAVAAQLLPLGRDNFPLVDLHTNLRGGLTLERALAVSRPAGIGLGIVAADESGAPVRDDAAARAFLDRLQGQPVFRALRPQNRGWTEAIAPETRARFDYILADATTFTPAARADEQAYMEELVALTVRILETEPVDVYARPTYLPPALAARAGELWTDERMQRVIAAAVARGVAIEIDALNKLPSERFVTLAKTAGAKFAFGTGNTSAADFGDRSYVWEMQKKASLNWRNMFAPSHQPTRAQRALAGQ